jgi:hypothetical protein
MVDFNKKRSPGRTVIFNRRPCRGAVGTPRPTMQDGISDEGRRSVSYRDLAAERPLHELQHNSGNRSVLSGQQNQELKLGTQSAIRKR